MTGEDSDIVYVIILNWLRWEETIPCLESVLKLDYPDYRVIICDNDSHNDSVAQLTAWLDGELARDFSNDARADLITPCARKPLSYQLLLERDLDNTAPPSERITVIRNEKNHGYAGGNNVGIRYALRDPGCRATWILNNDVVVAPDSLSYLVTAITDKIGIIGSSVLNYAEGDMQIPGGARYNRYSGKSIFLPPDGAREHEQLDYIAGCAMLLTREVLTGVGLLCEDYFLFYEEFDFAIRARRQGFELKYEANSVVYHKQSATTGKSGLVDFFTLRNRLLFTRQFFPECYLSVVMSVLLTAGVRVCRGQLRRGWMIAALAVNPEQQYDPARWSDEPTAGNSENQ